MVECAQPLDVLNANGGVLRASSSANASDRHHRVAAAARLTTAAALLNNGAINRKNNNCHRQSTIGFDRITVPMTIAPATTSNCSQSNCSPSSNCSQSSNCSPSSSMSDDGRTRRKLAKIDESTRTMRKVVSSNGNDMSTGSTSCLFLRKAVHQLFPMDDFERVEFLGEGFFSDVYKVRECKIVNYALNILHKKLYNYFG
jgi:hypothetical protein